MGLERRIKLHTFQLRVELHYGTQDLKFYGEATIKLFLDDNCILEEDYTNHHREYMRGLTHGLSAAGVGYTLTEERFADDPNWDDD